MCHYYDLHFDRQRAHDAQTIEGGFTLTPDQDILHRTHTHFDYARTFPFVHTMNIMLVHHNSLASAHDLCAKWKVYYWSTAQRSTYEPSINRRPVPRRRKCCGHAYVSAALLTPASKSAGARGLGNNLCSSIDGRRTPNLQNATNARAPQCVIWWTRVKSASLRRRTPSMPSNWHRSVHMFIVCTICIDERIYAAVVGSCRGLCKVYYVIECCSVSVQRKHITHTRNGDSNYMRLNTNIFKLWLKLLYKNFENFISDNWVVDLHKLDNVENLAGML